METRRSNVEIIALVLVFPLVLFIFMGIKFVFVNTRTLQIAAAFGQIEINAEALNYGFDIDDLHVVGLFRDVQCDGCDFSQSGLGFSLRGELESGVQVRLGRARTTFILSFFGEDSEVVADQTERILTELRERFPDDANAFSLIDPDTSRPIPIGQESTPPRSQ